MKLDHILVPYDGSEPSRRAYHFAADLAKKYHAHVTAVTCIQEDYYEPDTITPEELRSSQNLQNVAATKLLSTLEVAAKGVGVDFKGQVLSTPSIVDGLLSYAEKNGVDLIVMGSRGLGGFKKLLLGSVASGISHYSKCPVLITK
ncbi:MAG TPA: universal stress protein [Candidatus Nitrosotalea sp.]|nr:universal stress protein [Candidatus Nitrosotalea sp.]